MHALVACVNETRIDCLSSRLSENAKGVDGRDALTGPGSGVVLDLPFLGRAAPAAVGLPLHQVRPRGHVSARVRGCSQI